MSPETGKASMPEWGYPPRPPQLCNLDRLSAMMEAQDLEGMVSYQATNVFYLSGFVLGTTYAMPEADGFAAVLISRREPERPIVVVKDQATPYFLSVPSWIEEVRAYGGGSKQLDLPTEQRPVDKFVPAKWRGTPWADAVNATFEPDLHASVRRAMSDLGLTKGRVGFDNLTLAARVAVPSVMVVDVYDLMKSVRAIKTPPEIELIRQATVLNQTALERSVAAWEPGMTWHGFNHTYHKAVTDIGGFVHPAVPMAIANEPGGKNVSLEQTLREADYVIERGTNILIDAHGTWQRYCWDGGKTWVVDERLSGEGQKVARACGMAMSEIASHLKPGARVSELQRIGRSVFRWMGVASPEAAFIYFHGMGLEHGDRELPFDTRADVEGNVLDFSMSENMVMATHIAYPGADDVRHWIEDIALVRADGGESFFTWGVEPLYRS